MRTPGQHTSGPANSYAGVHGPNYPDASAFSKAPPKCTPHKSKRVFSEWISSITRRIPLISLPKCDRQPNGTCSYLLVILCISFLLCPLLYIYEDVRARTVHLAQENAALAGKIHGLQTKLHDLRGQLTDSKVLLFWEIARIMNTNTDTWVGANDADGNPQFWSYGITNGMFNDSPVTSTEHHITLSEAVIESTEHRRIVGYKVESIRRKNGWWSVTGLMEFGQSGSHEVKFIASSLYGAEYDVTVYYADWKL